MRARAASSEDAEAIARIYNEGIEERIATFETSPERHGRYRPGSMGLTLSWWWRKKGR